MKKILKNMLVILSMALLLSSLAGCGPVAKALLNRAGEETAKTDDTDADADDGEDKKEDEEKSKKKKSSKKKKQSNKDKDEEESEISEDMYKEDAKEVFAEMADWVFIFSSGAGGWGTELYVKPDGTFSGRYSDSEMGSTGPGYKNGTLYECDFSGRFSDEVRSVGPRMHSLKIESIEYEKEPGTEEIIDNILHVYSGVYGLEGLDDVTGYDSPLVFLEAGAVTSVFNEEEMNWVSMTHFGTNAGENWDYLEDVPDELPYAVLLNTVDDYAFFSENISEKNKTFLVNKAQLPGLKNMDCKINEDGTYYCVDENRDSSFRIINTCFKTTKLYDAYSDPETLVNDALKEVCGNDAPSPDDVHITSPKDAYEMSYPTMSVNGNHTDYAFWYPDPDSYDVCREARFLVQSGYQTDTSFVYVYMIETNKGKEYPDSAFAGQYISSLTLTGKSDNLSSAGKGHGAVRSILTSMKAPRNENVSAKELIMVSESDKDLIKKYHLEDADFDDDYEMVSPDNKYRNYRLAYGDSTPFYIQYPKDKVHSYNTAYALGRLMESENADTRLMQLYLNDSDEVVYAYEVYTP